jgi:protein involved in polysaccharide export with SLBB domain
MLSSFAVVRTICISVSALIVASASAADAPEERIVVVGQGRVSEMRYSPGLTVSKAIIAAGGIADLARPPVYLIRCGRSTPVDVQGLITGSERQRDTPLQPWDIITIGRKVGQRR